MACRTQAKRIRLVSLVRKVSGGNLTNGKLTTQKCPWDKIKDVLEALRFSLRTLGASMGVRPARRYILSQNANMATASWGIQTPYLLGNQVLLSREEIP